MPGQSASNVASRLRRSSGAHCRQRSGMKPTVPKPDCDLTMRVVGQVGPTSSTLPPQGNTARPTSPTPSSGIASAVSLSRGRDHPHLKASRGRRAGGRTRAEDETEGEPADSVEGLAVRAVDQRARQRRLWRRPGKIRTVQVEASRPSCGGVFPNRCRDGQAFWTASRKSRRRACGSFVDFGQHLRLTAENFCTVMHRDAKR